MDWGITLLREGPYAGLPDYEPSLVSSSNGSRISLVAHVEVRDAISGRGHLCRGVITGQRFRLVADIPTGVTKVTILGGSLAHIRGPVLTVDSQARVLLHKEKDLGHLFQLIETCSGLGGIGVGACHAGFKTQVHNDLMKSFCDHLAKYSGIEVVHGDICKLATVAAIHDKAPTAASIAFGFSCQPFSRLGDRREGQDQRSSSLPFSLYCAFLLQLDLVVTECVPEASQSPYVMRCMQQYMQATNSDRTEALLELSDLWPSKRRRWWSILLKSHMGRVSIPPFPRLPSKPTVASLLPGLLPMSDQELQELTLSVEERKMFEQYGKGLGGHMLNMTEPLATALHSWANQCVDCACGCRGPLSCSRLQAQGLFGVLAHVPNQTPDRNVRHLSAREMALLVGFPKSDGWSDHQRLLTAGVGQIASPIQSAWIFAAILNHMIDHGFCEGPMIPPKQILACVAVEVFKLRDLWFQNHATVAMEMFQESIEEFLNPGPSHGIPATIQDLSPSQDDELAKNIDAIEKQVCIEAAAPGKTAHTRLAPVGLASEDPPKLPAAHVATASGETPIASDRAPVSGCPEGSLQPEHMNNALVSNTRLGQTCDESRTSENSQRAGRKDPEEKKSGVTQRQPASRTPEPDKQPAKGPQEPLPSLPASVSVQPVQGVPGFSTAVMSTGSQENTQAMSMPGDVNRRPTAEHGDSSSHMWDNATGAIQAFATMIEAPKPPMQVMPKVRLSSPPEVCFPMSDVLSPGLLVYDVDNHQICRHHFSGQATVNEWIQGMHTMDVHYPYMSDIVGQPVQGDMQLAALKWIEVSQFPLPAQRPIHERSMHLQALPRHESILLQGGAVALDEMRYYLSAIDTVGIAKSWEPLLLHSLTDLHTEAAEWLGDLQSYAEHHVQGLRAVATSWWAEIPIEAIATMIWVSNHWVPVWLVPGTHTFAVHTTEEGQGLWGMLFPSWEGELYTHPAYTSQFAEDCGFQAYAWLISQCTHMEGNQLNAAEAAGWRQLYWQQTLITRPALTSLLLGGQTELETALHALLREHGVFPERLQDRVALVLKSLSHQALIGVFHATRPWQQLKQLATSHTPSIRLVLEDELQATIRARTKQKGSVRAKGASKGKGMPPVHLHPGDIVIPPGIFRVESGELVAQMDPKQIGQAAQGVVVFSEAEVQPYLKHQVNSSHGLGFLVLSPYTSDLAAQGEVHRFPVQSKVTGEPLLVSAVLLQRGKTRIVRNVPQQAPAIDQIETQTVKVLVYRDQCTDWDAVTSQPVKHIISQFEELKICKEPRCSCPRWHPHEQANDSPILDVWQRDFLTSHFQKTKASEAQLYAVAMRLPVPIFKQLYIKSGHAGIYFEPRREDGRSQDEAFHTVWIPKRPHSEVVALQAMLDTQVSLIRVGARYGFKVPTADAAQLHEKVSPGAPFIAGPSKATYRVGPFPWGTTKKAIQQLFQQWGWVARAVHSVAKAKDSSGLMWLVHANSPPGHLVYQLQHGDVIIHQDPQQSKDTWRPPQAQASRKEVQAHQFDEVYHNDPWADSAMKLRKLEVTAAQLSALEATIDQKISHQLGNKMQDHDEQMPPTIEPRIQALEQQMAQLHQRSIQLDGRVEYLHQQVEHQSAKFESALDSKLQDQMHRIEMLMTKRARSTE